MPGKKWYINEMDFDSWFSLHMYVLSDKFLEYARAQFLSQENLTNDILKENCKRLFVLKCSETGIYAELLYAPHDNIGISSWTYGYPGEGLDELPFEVDDPYEMCIRLLTTIINYRLLYDLAPGIKETADKVIESWRGGEDDCDILENETEAELARSMGFYINDDDNWEDDGFGPEDE